MRRSLRLLLVVFALSACNGGGAAATSDTDGGSGGASGEPTGMDADGSTGATTASTTAASTGDPSDCETTEDCGDNEVCHSGSGECICAEGYLDCADVCVPEHDAEIEVSPFEVVDDSPFVGRQFDLEVGPAGEPVVAYSHDLDDVWIGRRGADAWAIEFVYGPAYARVDGAALAHGSDGTAQVKVVEFENGTNTWRSGTSTDEGWAFGYDLSRDNSSGGRVDLVVDDAGVVHTAYAFRFFSTSQMHVWVSPDSQARAVPLDAGLTYSRLMIDGEGTPHLAYDIPGRGVVHTYFDGDEWVDEEIEPLPTNIGVGGPYLALAPDGRPVVSYIRQGPDEFVVAHRDDAGWSPDVAWQGLETRYVAFAVDGAGAEHVLYQREDLSIAYARNDGVAWSHHDLPGGPDFAPPTLAVNDDGRTAHITWIYGATLPDEAELRYAKVAIDRRCD